MAGPLNHSPADITARLLIALGYSASPSGDYWPIFVGDEPSGPPDDTVTVFDTLGRGDGRSMVSGRRFQHYGFQVRIRCQEYALGYEQLNAIQVGLDEDVRNAVLSAGSNEYEIACYSGIKPIVSLGKIKGTELKALVFNGLVTIRQL